MQEEVSPDSSRQCVQTSMRMYRPTLPANACIDVKIHGVAIHLKALKRLEWWKQIKYSVRVCSLRTWARFDSALFALLATSGLSFGQSQRVSLLMAECSATKQSRRLVTFTTPQSRRLVAFTTPQSVKHNTQKPYCIKRRVCLHLTEHRPTGWASTLWFLY